MCISKTKEFLMSRQFNVLASFVLVAVLVSGAADANWPHWRGPNENGLVDAGNPPVEWSEEKNIRWKTPIP